MGTKDLVFIESCCTRSQGRQEGAFAHLRVGVHLLTRVGSLESCLTFEKRGSSTWFPLGGSRSINILNIPDRAHGPAISPSPLLPSPHSASSRFDIPPADWPAPDPKNRFKGSWLKVQGKRVQSEDFQATAPKKSLQIDIAK